MLVGKSISPCRAQPLPRLNAGPHCRADGGGDVSNLTAVGDGLHTVAHWQQVLAAPKPVRQS